MKNTKKRLAAIATAAVVMAGIGGIAYAFSEFSTANAAGATADMQPLEIGKGNDAPKLDFAGSETALWPNVGGNHVAKALVTVKNTNDVSVRVTSADIVGSVQFGNGVNPNCTGKIHVSDPVVLTGGTVDIAKNETKVLEVTGVYLDTDANNVCQNAAFTTAWTVTANAL